MFSTEPTTPFIIGSILVILQGLIRDQCYRALGDLYTFEFTFRKDHKLITTGPYSIVRHPAYAAGCVGMVGMLMCQFSQGTWMRESGVLGTALGKVGVGVWVFFEVVRRSVAIARASREDEALKKVFGNAWTEWSEKVKYLLFPGIY
jgi:protein-S-isoprenylcysteine O-methyltransferase Ste14